MRRLWLQVEPTSQVTFKPEIGINHSKTHKNQQRRHFLWSKEILPNGLRLILEHPTHGRRRIAERDVAPVLVTNALHPLQR